MTSDARRRQAITDLFQIWDLDGSGDVDASELQQVLNSFDGLSGKSSRKLITRFVTSLLNASHATSKGLDLMSFYNLFSKLTAELPSDEFETFISRLSSRIQQVATHGNPIRLSVWKAMQHWDRTRSGYILQYEVEAVLQELALWRSFGFRKRYRRAAAEAHRRFVKAAVEAHGALHGTDGSGPLPSPTRPEGGRFSAVLRGGAAGFADRTLDLLPEVAEVPNPNNEGSLNASRASLEGGNASNTPSATATAPCATECLGSLETAVLKGGPQAVGLVPLRLGDVQQIFSALLSDLPSEEARILVVKAVRVVLDVMTLWWVRSVTKRQVGGPSKSSGGGEGGEGTAGGVDGSVSESALVRAAALAQGVGGGVHPIIELCRKEKVLQQRVRGGVGLDAWVVDSVLRQCPSVSDGWTAATVGDAEAVGTLVWWAAADVLVGGGGVAPSDCASLVGVGGIPLKVAVDVLQSDAMLAALGGRGEEDGERSRWVEVCSSVLEGMIVAGTAGGVVSRRAFTSAYVAVACAASTVEEVTRSSADTVAVLLEAARSLASAYLNAPPPGVSSTWAHDVAADVACVVVDIPPAPSIAGQGCLGEHAQQLRDGACVVAKEARSLFVRTGTRAVGGATTPGAGDFAVADVVVVGEGGSIVLADAVAAGGGGGGDGSPHDEESSVKSPLNRIPAEAVDAFARLARSLGDADASVDSVNMNESGEEVGVTDGKGKAYGAAAVAKLSAEATADRLLALQLLWQAADIADDGAVRIATLRDAMLRYDSNSHLPGREKVLAGRGAQKLLRSVEAVKVAGKSAGPVLLADLPDALRRGLAAQLDLEMEFEGDVAGDSLDASSATLAVYITCAEFAALGLRLSSHLSPQAFNTFATRTADAVNAQLEARDPTAWRRRLLRDAFKVVAVVAPSHLAVGGGDASPRGLVRRGSSVLLSAGAHSPGGSGEGGGVTSPGGLLLPGGEDGDGGAAGGAGSPLIRRTSFLKASATAAAATAAGNPVATATGGKVVAVIPASVVESAASACGITLGKPYKRARLRCALGVGPVRRTDPGSAGGGGGGGLFRAQSMLASPGRRMGGGPGMGSQKMLTPHSPGGAPASPGGGGSPAGGDVLLTCGSFVDALYDEFEKLGDGAYRSIVNNLAAELFRSDVAAAVDAVVAAAGSPSGSGAEGVDASAFSHGGSGVMKLGQPSRTAARDVASLTVSSEGVRVRSPLTDRPAMAELGSVAVDVNSESDSDEDGRKSAEAKQRGAAAGGEAPTSKPPVQSAQSPPTYESATPPRATPSPAGKQMSTPQRVPHPPVVCPRTPSGAPLPPPRRVGVTPLLQRPLSVPVESPDGVAVLRGRHAWRRRPTRPNVPLVGVWADAAVSQPGRPRRVIKIRCDGSFVAAAVGGMATSGASARASEGSAKAHTDAYTASGTITASVLRASSETVFPNFSAQKDAAEAELASASRVAQRALRGVPVHSAMPAGSVSAPKSATAPSCWVSEFPNWLSPRASTAPLPFVAKVLFDPDVSDAGRVLDALCPSTTPAPPVPPDVALGASVRAGVVNEEVEAEIRRITNASLRSETVAAQIVDAIPTTGVYVVAPAPGVVVFVRDGIVQAPMYAAVEVSTALLSHVVVPPKAGAPPSGFVHGNAHDNVSVRPTRVGDGAQVVPLALPQPPAPYVRGLDGVVALPDLTECLPELSPADVYAHSCAVLGVPPLQTVTSAISRVVGAWDLVELNMEHSRALLGDRAILPLLQTARYFKNLDTLILRGCGLSADGAAAVVAAAALWFPRLEILDLGANPITSRAAVAVAWLAKERKVHVFVDCTFIAQVRGARGHCGGLSILRENGVGRPGTPRKDFLRQLLAGYFEVTISNDYPSRLGEVPE